MANGCDGGGEPFADHTNTAGEEEMIQERQPAHQQIMGNNNPAIIRLRLFSIVYLTVSIFFLGWALVNTFFKPVFDLGIISFSLSGLSSLYLFLISSRKGTMSAGAGAGAGAAGGFFKPPTAIGRILILISHLFVALNYAGVAYMLFRSKQVDSIQFAYFLIFMILWLMSAVVGWTLVTNVMDIAEED